MRSSRRTRSIRTARPAPRLRCACPEAATRGRTAEEALAAVLAEVGPADALVAISHVSWMTGHILPLAGIKAET